MPITRKAFTSTGGYFTGPEQRAARDYFTKWHAQLLKTQPQVKRALPAEEVAFAAGSQTMLLYIPDYQASDGVPRCRVDCICT